MKSSKYDEAKKLIEADGINFNLKIGEDKISPFEEACFAGNKELVKLMIEHGAGIMSDNALIYAVRGGHKGIVKGLIYNGADIIIGDDEENTPLHLACSMGDEEMI